MSYAPPPHPIVQNAIESPIIAKATDESLKPKATENIVPNQQVLQTQQQPAPPSQPQPQYIPSTTEYVQNHSMVTVAPKAVPIAQIIQTVSAPVLTQIHAQPMPTMQHAKQTSHAQLPRSTVDDSEAMPKWVQEFKIQQSKMKLEILKRSEP